MQSSHPRRAALAPRSSASTALLPPLALGERRHRGLARRFAPIAARGGQTIATRYAVTVGLAGALALTAPTITDQSMNTKTSEGVTCITPPATPPVTSSVPQALAVRPMRCCTNRRTMVRQQKRNDHEDAHHRTDSSCSDCSHPVPRACSANGLVRSQIT